MNALKALKYLHTVPCIFLDAAKIGIGLIFSVNNWDQSKLVCKGAYQRVIRYHHEIRPQPQSSLIRGHFPQKPGFTKMAVGQRWPMNNLISFWQFLPRLWWPHKIGAKCNSLKMAEVQVQKSCFLLIKMAIFQHYWLQFWGCWILRQMYVAFLRPIT